MYGRKPYLPLCAVDLLDHLLRAVDDLLQVHLPPPPRHKFPTVANST
jgi:hypothetical protein